MQPTPNVLGAPANGLLGRWGGSKYNQLNPTALSGMTAWYDANERNTLFVDASGRTSVVSNRAEDGGDRFLYLNGASGTYASTPDSAALSITGDIDIRAQIAFANATPNTYQTFIGKWTTTGNQFAYSLDIAANNRINLYWSTNGSNALLVQSTVAPTFVVNQPIWIRATLDVDNGSGGYSVQFFTSSDGSSWTQLGSTVTQAGVTSIFDSTAILEIGSNRVGSTDRMSGRFYRAQIYNGINGTLAFDANFTTHTTGSAPLRESANGAVVSFLGNARVTYVGPTNCLCLNGASGQRATQADAAALRVTGDIDLRCEARLASWASGAIQVFLSKNTGAAGTYAYAFYVTAAGTLTLAISTDGTALSLPAATANLTDTFTRRWVRVTRAAASGNTNFFTSTDGVTWSQLGSANVASTAGNIFAGTAELHFGAQGTGSVVNGNIFSCQVRSGIDGTIVSNPNFTTAPKLANSFTESSANAATVTINSTGDLGARIAGEKDLVQLTTTKQPIYLPWSGTNYGWLRGNAADFFSTPDSASVSVTGDIDLRAEAALNSWTAPSTAQYLLAKMTGAATDRSYSLHVRTDGFLVLTWSPDGTSGATIAVASTSALTFAAFQRAWVRATLDVDNGASGYTATFFTSTDGTTWNQLGLPVVGGATTSIFNGTLALNIGIRTGGAESVTGSIFRAQVLNGINGTVVADFNPTLYTSGTAVLDGSVSTQSLVLDGSSGAYASTPDSAALSITGDIDLRWYGTQLDWTPAATTSLVSKRGSGQDAYTLRIQSLSTGIIQFAWWTGGSATLVNSTVAPTVTDGQLLGIRATLDVDNGSGGKTVTFFTSSDFVTWTQLGSAVTTSGTTTIDDTTAPLWVGGASGVSEPSAGRVFRAQVLNGIDGTIAFDANFAVTPSLTATSFTESSSNAATVTLNGTATIGPKWTLNGGSTIVNRTSLYFDGSDDYMKAPAFALSQPETVYFVGQQVSWTNGDDIFDGNAINTMRVAQNGSTPRVDLFAGSFLTGPTTFSVATTGVLSSVFNGASSAVRFNRNTALTGNAGSNNASGFTLGNRGDAGAASNIRANEIAIYAAAQDTSTQNRWALYAGKKWGFNI